MLSPILLFASTLQDPLYPGPRFEPMQEASGSVDFNLDGFDDVYSWTGILLSDVAFVGKALGFVQGNGEPIVVDLNGDGHPDLASPSQSSGAQVMLFEPATETLDVGTWSAERMTESIAAGDVDGDGHADLFT